jgi:hypothetical protein
MITRRIVSALLGLGWLAVTRRASAQAPQILPSLRNRADILSALQRDHLLSAHRTVVDVSIVGTLTIGGALYPVVNLIEAQKTAHGSRGYRRVVVLRPNLQKAFVLPYHLPAAPIGCRGNVLTFSHAVDIDNTLPDGRQVVFTNGGADAQVIEAP